MQKAQAFIFAAEEDFGIIPVEAQACGTPVIAFARGGTLETVITQGTNVTGVFFQQQTVSDVCQAVIGFEGKRNFIKSIDCRNNAEKFSVERFRQEFKQFVLNKYKTFKENCFD